MHAALQWKALVAHLRLRWSMGLGVLLAGVMALLFVEGLTRPIDDDGLDLLER